MFLSLFNFPAADDFCYAATAKELGFWPAQLRSYDTWTGRYVATLVISAVVASPDLLTAARVVPVAILAGTFLAFWFLCTVLAPRAWPRSAASLAAAVLTALYIAGTPDPAQTFFWTSGAMTYQLAVIATVLLIALVASLELRELSRAASAGVTLLSAALIVAAAGSNEVSACMIALLTGAGTATSFGLRRRTRYAWAVLLAITLVALAASYLAPGNMKRIGSLTGDGQLRPPGVLAAALYLPWVALRLVYWASNVGTWASAMLLFVATHGELERRLRIDGRFRKRLLLVPGVWLGGICALQALGFLANRYPLPERAESVVHLLFLLGWYPSFLVLMHYWGGSALAAVLSRGAAPLALALAAGILGAPTAFEAYKDSYRGYRFYREMSQRFSIIQASAGKPDIDVVVPSLSRAPRTLLSTELTSDPANFRNACVSRYYGVRSIRIGLPETR